MLEKEIYHFFLILVTLLHFLDTHVHVLVQMFSLQLPNDRAAIFTAAYAEVRLHVYYTKLQIHF